MKPCLLERIFMARVVWIGLLMAVCASAWGMPEGCAYPGGEKAGGTGMGGTGATANGSGIGGTGITPRAEPAKAEFAGNVIFSQGVVEAQSAGHTRLLAKGAIVCVGETIVTSPASQVQIRMADGGMISLRPETIIRIAAFHFDGKEDGTERSEIALVQGRFRAMTGMVGHTHKDHYVIQTPNAYIGIRGTDHEPMYIPVPAPGQVPQGTPGTYDKVNSGGVVIRTPQGSVEVRPNQVGFAPSEANVPPTLLKEMPRFYQAGADEVRPSGTRGNKDTGERGGAERNRETPPASEIKVPEPHDTEIKSPEITVPEIHEPEVHVPEE